jgi:hypothetical protein
MKWFVVERLVYLYMLIFALLTFFGVISSWHIAFDYAKSFLINRSRKVEWLLLAVFAAVPFGFVYVADINLFIRIGRYFVISRMIGNVCLAVLLIYLARKKSNAHV